jgi:hypothetical protein
MVSYRGYFIYGKALVIRPQAWRSLGVICAKTSRGSIIEITHILKVPCLIPEKPPKTMPGTVQKWLDKNLPSTKA